MRPSYRRTPASLLTILALVAGSALTIVGASTPALAVVANPVILRAPVVLPESDASGYGYGAASIWGSGVGDVNGDGSPDAVWITKRCADTGCDGNGQEATVDFGAFTSLDPHNGAAPVFTPLPYAGAFDSPYIFLGVYDLTGDGRADLIMESTDSYPDPSHDVMLRPGKADGTFGAVEDLGIRVGDARGLAFTPILDGHTPALVYTETNAVKVLTYTGPTTPPTTVTILGPDTGAFGNSTIAFNVATLEASGLPSLVAYDGSVLHNNGGGAFTVLAAPTQPPLDAVGQLSTADINGDGRADLIDVCACGDPLAAYFQVRYRIDGGSTGQWSANPVTLFRAVGPPSDIHAVDINRDGKSDFVFSAPQAVVTFQNTGSGTGSGFAPSFAGRSYACNCGQMTVLPRASADPDLIFSGVGLSVMRNLGSGEFDAPNGSLSRYESTGAQTAAALVNGSPLRSIIGTNEIDRYSVLYRQGSDGHIIPTRIDTPDAWSEVHAGDVNGDGNVDLVGWSRYGDSISVDFGDGKGHVTPSDFTYSLQNSEPTNGFSRVGPFSLVDLNNDGHLDAVVGGSATQQTSSTAPETSVLLGRADGTFGSATNLLKAAPLAVADVTGDGHPDLIGFSYRSVIDPSTGYTESAADIHVSPGVGNGAFGADQITQTSLVTIYSIEVGNLNADNHPDLVLNVGSTYSGSATGSPILGGIYVMKRASDNTGFTAPERQPGPSSRNPTVTLADVTNDGLLDVISGGLDTTVRPGRGDGTLGAPTSYLAGGYSNPIVAPFEAAGGAQVISGALQSIRTTAQSPSAAENLDSSDSTAAVSHVLATYHLPTDSPKVVVLYQATEGTVGAIVCQSSTSAAPVRPPSYAANCTTVSLHPGGDGFSYPSGAVPTSISLQPYDAFGRLGGVTSTPVVAGNASNNTAPSPDLLPVGSLAATNPSPGTGHLTWSASTSTNAWGYEVSRVEQAVGTQSGNPFPETTVAIVAGLSTTSTDVPVPTDLTGCQTCTFRVRTINDAGFGSTPAQVVVVPPPAVVVPTAPGPPTAVNAVVGEGAVTVGWTAPISDGNSAITGYTATASPGGAICSSEPTTTSCYLSGLTGGTPYTFTVTATNTIGTSAASSPSSPVTPTAAAVPGAPSAVHGTPGSTSISVGWTPPAADGGSAILGYVALASPGGHSCSTTGAASCVVLGLANPTQYTFTVTAHNAVGTGAPSAASAAVTPRDTTIPAIGVAALPLFTLGTAVGPFAFAGSDGGSGLANFDVRYRRAAYNGVFGGYSYPGSWQHTTATRVSLAAPQGYTYCLSARSRDRAGNVSGWREVCSAVPLDDRGLAPSAGWVRTSGSGFYLHTATTIAKAGATLTRTGIQARRIYLVATACHNCGSIAIYWNGHLVKQLSLNATTTHHAQVVGIVGFSTAQSGTLVIKTITAGPVYIDGLGLSRT